MSLRVPRGSVVSVCALALVVLCAHSARGQTNLVSNGSFELPVLEGGFAQRTSAAPFGGWAVDPIGQGIVHVGSYGNPASIAGNQSVELNYFSSGGISQTLTTVPGQQYIVDFLMAGQLNAGPDVKQTRVDFGGAAVGVATWSRSGTGGQWVRYSFTATATGASTVLHLLGITPANDDGGPYIDDVRVYCLGISTQPQSRSGCVGTSVSFSVVAAGSGGFVYQWRRDGVAISAGANPSAATAVLTVAGVRPSDAGAYDCVVSNSCGTLTSAAAALTVPARCSLADLAVGGTCPDGTVDGADFVAFINSFGLGDPSIDPLADVAGGGADGLSPDSLIDGSDFIAFVNAFAIGC